MRSRDLNAQDGGGIIFYEVKVKNGVGDYAPWKNLDPYQLCIRDIALLNVDKQWQMKSFMCT